MQNTANNSQENLRGGDELTTGGGSGAAGAQQLAASSVPISKWSNEKVLDWFSRRFPAVYDLYKDCFTQSQITGENLLEFNTNCLDQMKIFDTNLRYLSFYKYPDF